MAQYQIETGTSQTAIGNGVVRSEQWTTTLDDSSSSVGAPSTTGGNYGFINSNRLNYTIMYLADGTPKLIPQGILSTTRSIDINCT